MKKVTIVGVGAIGSHVALLLRNEATLRIVDMDRVESKNVMSQFHGRPGVGKGKVQSLQQSMQLMFGLRIEGIPHRLTEDNQDQLLSGSDLIVDCLDNAKSRIIVQSYARRTGTPCLHGALAPGGQFGQAIWDPAFRIDDESGMGGATCENGEHLPFIAMVSALVAQSAKLFLREGRTVGFQAYPGGFNKV
jgi:molybdopterin/thiamine biosynthesis adenylyltransferase